MAPWFNLGIMWVRIYIAIVRISLPVLGFFISTASAQTTTSTQCGQTITYPLDGCGSGICPAPITITGGGSQSITTDGNVFCVSESDIGDLNFNGTNNNLIRFCGTNLITGIGTNFGTGNAFVNTRGSELHVDYSGFGHTNHLTIINYGTLFLEGSTNFDATTIYNVGNSAIISTSGDFIVNGDDSIFIIGGALIVNGEFGLNNGTALFCFSDDAGINAVDVQVNSPNEIHVDPGSNSCLRYTGSADANSNITQDAFSVCMAPGATPIQSFQSWGPNVTVTTGCLATCRGGKEVLPIKLRSFVANVNLDNTVSLQWVSSEEINTLKFEVERSNTGASFETIAIVNAAGNSGTDITYAYSDKQPLTGANYYRLKMVDIDGTYTYSPVRTVGLTVINNLKWTINSNNELVVYLPPVNSNASVRLIEISGKILWQQHVNINQLTLTIPVSNIASGIYIIGYSDSKTRQSVQVFIQK